MRRLWSNAFLSQQWNFSSFCGNFSVLFSVVALALLLTCKFLTQDNKPWNNTKFIKLHHPKFWKASPFCHVLCLVLKTICSYHDNSGPHWKSLSVSFWHGFYLHMLQTALLLNRLVVILPVTDWDNWCDNDYNFLIPGESGHAQLCAAEFSCSLL